MEDYKDVILDKWSREYRLNPFDLDRVELEFGAVLLAFGIAYFKDGMVMQFFLTFFLMTYGVLMTFSKAQFVRSKERMFAFGIFNALNLFLLCGGALMKTMSWPNASTCLMIGALGCMAYHLFMADNEFRFFDKPKLKGVLWAVSACYILFIIAFLLDFQFWPFASQFFLGSALFSGVLLCILLYFLIKDRHFYAAFGYYLPKLLFIFLIGSNQFFRWLPAAII
jgi:hypothetical protein